MIAMRSYALVTVAYWAFTLTDGALRMLVLLHFNALGYSPIQLAFLFLLYEFFGVVTNLVGGWLAARMGLNVTLLGGLALQIVSLAMLVFVRPEWTVAVSVAYVMAAQALSGIAKDLTKMSSKSAIKTLVPADASSSLFKWVAILTGSKNALKGVGFFLGGFLLTTLGYIWALWAMAIGLGVILLWMLVVLPRELGKAKSKAKFSTLLSKNRNINVLSAARFFLFGSRDIWFVVAVPVFLSNTLNWNFTQAGTFLALWVIGYGIIQSVTPALIRRWTHGRAPQGRAALVLALLLAVVTALIPLGLMAGWPPETVVLGGLALYGAIFAVNSSVHSYLILAYSDGDKVALNVGFYYMANAGGRLIGTLLSGLMYQYGGLSGCLWTSVGFVVATALLSMLLPASTPEMELSAVADSGGID